MLKYFLKQGIAGGKTWQNLLRFCGNKFTRYRQSNLGVQVGKGEMLFQQILQCYDHGRDQYWNSWYSDIQNKFHSMMFSACQM